MAKFRLPPQHLALGAFTINAIPEGYVVPKGNKFYEICVNKVFIFVNDSFNFEGNQFFGYWKLNPDHPITEDLPFDTVLGNSEFRGYRRHGYGRYFPVLSRLHELEDFQPVCWRHKHAR